MRAALSLDLDNKWSYMKTHGDAGWETFPSYLDVVVPRVMSTLSERNLFVTIFVVGQDTVLPQNAQAFEQIRSSGHEIGNHSFHHQPWMHRQNVDALHEEFARAEDGIELATGQHPRGFRGPGFVHSRALIATLAQRGYDYDASSLPTFIGPLARAYYFRTSRLSAQERSERTDLFGNFSDGLRPNGRYRITTPQGSIVEIPVTTFPGLRTPIHVSYVLYLATISPALALWYFRTALALCKATRTEPSILLHPLDFLTAAECPELGFFPAMDMDPGTKRDVLQRALDILAREFTVVPLFEIAAPEKERLSQAVPDSVHGSL